MRKICFDIDEALAATNEKEPVQTEVPGEVTRIEKRSETRNGHVSTKKRRLKPEEKDFIRSVFMAKDGIIEDDDCVAMLNGSLYVSRNPDGTFNVGSREPVYDNPDLSIFQITGFVSYLHREVRRGRVKLKDMERYNNFLNQKYGVSEYESPKFTAFTPPRKAQRKRSFSYAA